MLSLLAKWMQNSRSAFDPSSRVQRKRSSKNSVRRQRFFCFERLEARELFAALAYDPVAQTAIRNQLLSGVAQIADMGAEGSVAVFGDHATSVFQTPERQTILAAVDNGVSRIIAGAKTGFADFANSSQFNTNTFYLNSLNWLSKGLGNSARIVTDLSSARTWLLSQGFTNVTLRSDWQNGLGNADLLVTWFGNPTIAQQTATNNFLASGHGMFVGYNGWAYSGGTTPKTSGGNALLRQYGISWTDSAAYSFTGTILLGTEAANAVIASAIEAAPASYTTSQQTESSLAIKETFDSVLGTDPQLVAIRQAVLANASTSIPTPSSIVSDPNDLIRLKIESAVLPNLLPNELFVHRTASSYGVIPVGSPRVSKTLTFNVSSANAQSQWLSTGLYAAPGETLIFTVPTAIVNQGWSWKIGSHDDDNSAKTTFKRMPFGVSRDEPINAASIQSGSVYGGVIYLVKPTTLATATGSYEVTINNAMEVPYFVLGQTTDAQWISSLRDLPAPYSELQSSGVIITLHSDDIRTLSNPTAVMTYWQDRMAAEDDLTNSPVPRTRAERIDDDLDISAGFMHSGYPVAAYGHNLANMVDSDPGDDWGFFHEFGHNHQSTYWTFSTETEITVNIMSMRAFDSAGTVPTDGWSNMWTAAGRAANIPTFVAGGRLRTDAGDSLTAYAQLREAFGWEPFRQFFRQYQTDLPANLPTTDQQERDQWVTRFSNIVGKNLGPYFNAWGFAASTTALNAVASLPAWSFLEAVTPDPKITAIKNNSVTFDPRTGFVDIMAVPLTVTFANPPAIGSLVTNANGTFTYTPPTNWTGRLLWPYSIANLNGGVSSGTVTLNVVNQAVVGVPVDTHVRMDAPNTSNAATTTLLVDGSTSANQPAQMLLQFSNLFGTVANQIPANAVIVKATVQLQVTDAGTSILFHRMLTPWVHTDTWNSLVNGIQTYDIEAASVPDLTTPAVTTGARTFDLTNSVQAWKANPATNFGWALMPTSTDSVSISSAESATPPKLTVEYFVPSVAGRQVFYNRSTSTVFGDGSGNPVNSIDSSKQALLPGQTATFANVTNYSQGINGLVVDVSNLPATPTATDFQFAIWNGTSSGGFVTLTTQPTIARIIGGGSNGSDRIKIEFGDNVMRNTWLRVTLLANANTGLASNDIFYFGNAVAEMNVDNLSNAIRVNSSDAVAVRQNLSIVANSVGITNIYDVNKDGRVNAIDVSIVRQNQATTRSLAYFTAPASLRISVIPGLNVGSAVPLFKSPMNMFNVDTVFSNVDLGTIATALLISRSSF